MPGFNDVCMLTRGFLNSGCSQPLDITFCFITNESIFTIGVKFACRSKVLEPPVLICGHKKLSFPRWYLFCHAVT